MSKVIMISAYIAKRSEGLVHVNCPLCERLVAGVQRGALAVYKCDGGKDAHQPISWEHQIESVMTYSRAG